MLMKKCLFSYYAVTIPTTQKSRALSLIIASSLTYKSAYTLDNKFYIKIAPKQAIEYEKIFKNGNIEYEIEKYEGSLASLLSIRKRIGIIIGLIITLVALYFSSNVVWKINVIGSTAISKEEVISELESAGLTLGTFIPTIDYDTLHNRVLLNSKHLSWVSINIVGNVANVNVREKQEKENTSPPTYSNVIASSDGYIEQIRVINGKKVAKIGQVVRKGDILISGIIDSASEGVRYEQASGEVFAYVNKKIKVKIPFKTTEKAYTGNRYEYKSYKIYNFPINFSTNYGNQVLFYDKIVHREFASLFGIKNLPVETVTTILYEYEYREIELTKEEADDKAFSELRAQMDSSLKDAELINKTVTTSFDENGFYIDCELYCLENIAKIQEFYVTK